MGQQRRRQHASSGQGATVAPAPVLLLAALLALGARSALAMSEPAPAAAAGGVSGAVGSSEEAPATNPMGLTGGDVLGNLATHLELGKRRGGGGGFFSFLGWGKRQRDGGAAAAAAGEPRKRTPFFIPPEMMRLPEEEAAQEGVGEGGGAAEVTYAWQEETVEALEMRALTDEEESEAAEVASVLVTRMTKGSGTISSSGSEEQESEEVVVEEEVIDEDVVVDAETAEQLLAVAEAAAAAAERDEDDGIPNGRSLLASLSVIGGGLPLKRGGSDALFIKATGPAKAEAGVGKPAAPTAAGAMVAAAADEDADEEEDVDELVTATEVERAEEEHDEPLAGGAGVAHVRTVTTTTRETTVARHVHTHVHAHTHREETPAEGRLTTLLDPSAAAHGLSEAELALRFQAATAERIAALSPEKRAAMEELREYLYGPDVSPERVKAADQLVVCGDRGAMMLAFLGRKNFDVPTAKKSFDRVIQWRIDEKIETVIEDGRLERAKVEKHRECWPTAFYERDCQGDPIFVDRMGILDLNRLKKDPLALDMNDMVTYYIQTMESRRRLLFPHLSRRTGRLVTQCVMVVDVANFGPMHFGGHALGFMKEMGNVHDENWSDVTKSLYIINAPGGWLFRNVFRLIQRMMSEEVKDRLKILSRKDSVKELAKITDPATAQRIVEGDHELERAVERELHEFLDLAARERQHHRESWVGGGGEAGR